MTYHVTLTAPARRNLVNLPTKVASAVLKLADGELARHPRRVGKALHGDVDGLFSARRGSYRLIYRINEDAQQVEIVRVSHRADVYR